jgi:hypothetical protein
MADLRRWSIELDLREDALSVFVPCELMPAAQIGDAVVINADGPLPTHAGRVGEIVDDETRGRYFVVAIE